MQNWLFLFKFDQSFEVFSFQQRLPEIDPVSCAESKICLHFELCSMPVHVRVVSRAVKQISWHLIIRFRVTYTENCTQRLEVNVPNDLAFGSMLFPVYDLLELKREDDFVRPAFVSASHPQSTKARHLKSIYARAAANKIKSNLLFR